MNELNSMVPSTPTGVTKSDAETLQSLIADLASPSTEATVLPTLTPAQEAYNARVMDTEFAKAQSVECIPQSAQVAAASSRQAVAAPAPNTVRTTVLPIPEPEPEPTPEYARPEKIFLTGLPGTGILELLKGADVHVINIRELVNNSLKTTCGLNGNPPASVITEFRKFGDGEYIPNLNNILQLGLLRRTAPEFGTPAYWARTCILAAAHAVDGKQVFVVGLRTVAEFKLLAEAGFVHYHVMCAPSTRAARTNPNETASQLAPAIEADVQKKISVARTGPRLNVVWNDAGIVPPVQRFYSAESFRKEVVGFEAPVVESDLISQVL
jgi:hypothetical protein